MIENCPKCLYKATEEEHKLSPLSCPRCECLYSAREYVNEEKRRKNQERKAWRVTRWRPKYKTGFALGIPAMMVIMYIAYHIGHYIIAYSRPISNELYILTKREESEKKGTPTKENLQTLSMPQNATMPTPSSKKLSSVEKGILTITSKKDVSIIFTLNGTNKKFGPYKIRGIQPEKISLERGIYMVQINEDGKKRFTVVSFLGRTGELNL